jgi:RimJ/RimL family protein N-acetyltransferase
MTRMDVLRGETVVLRQFRPDDAPDVAAGCDDPLTQRFLPLLPSPYTLDDAQWWIAEGSRVAFESGGFNVALADPATDRLVGGGGVRAQGHGGGMIGYWVAPWARGRGIASEATRLMTNRAFAQGYERLVLRTEPENTASQRVALAAGYHRESVERSGGSSRGGGRHDLIVWSRLSTDPDEPTHRVLPDLPGGELTDGVVTLRPLTESTRPTPTRCGICRTWWRRRYRPASGNWTRSAPSVPARRRDGWPGQRADFTIRDATDGRYAGEIGLYYWEPSTQQAMIGYSLMPEFRGRGFTTRAVRLLVRLGFRACRPRPGDRRDRSRTTSPHSGCWSGPGSCRRATARPPARPERDPRR